MNKQETILFNQIVDKAVELNNENKVLRQLLIDIINKHNEVYVTDELLAKPIIEARKQLMKILA